MIPVYLKIKGLYSYRTEQEINFDKLTEVAIFGIFGKVGSGKSAILDAITLALYERVERWDGNVDKYDLMNLRSNNLFIDFHFRTGRNNQLYKIEIVGTRDLKSFEKVKFNRTFYQNIANPAASGTEGGKWATMQEKPENIIGISFENFKRTVIIPQNKFQEFIALGDKDRSRMMNELFHLDRFVLYDKAAFVDKINARELDILKKDLEPIAHITPEFIRQKQEELKQLEQSVEDNKQRLEQFQKENETLESLKVDYFQLKETTTLLEVSNTQLPHFQQVEQDIKDYQFCLNHFKTLFERRNDIIKSKNVLLHEIDLKKQESVLKKQELEVAQKAVANLKTDFDNREQLAQRANDLKHISHILEFQKSLKIETNRKEALKEDVQKTEANIQQLREKMQKTDAAVGQTQSQMTDWVALSQIKQWYSDNKNLSDKKTDYEKQIQHKTAQMQNLRKDKDGHLNGVFLPPSLSLREVSGQSTTDDLLFHLAEYLNTLKHTWAQSQLHVHALNLQDGQPCPLCGALHHPNPLEADAEKRTQIIDFEANIAQYEKIILQLNTLKTRFEALNQERSSLIEKCKDVQHELENHKKQFVWAQFQPENETAFNQYFTQAATFQKQLETLQKEKQLISTQLDTSLKNKEAVQQAFQKQELILMQLQTEIRAAEKQITKLSALADYANQSPQQLQETVQQLDNQYNTIAQQFENATTKTRNIEIDLGLISNFLTIKQADILKYDTDLNTLQTTLAQTIHQYNFNENRIETILNDSRNWANEQTNLNAYKQQREIFHLKIKELETKLQGTQYDADKHAALKLDIQNLNDLRDKQSQKIGGLKGLIAQLNTDFLRLQDMQHQQAELQLKAKDLQLMLQLFKANGFVNFVSSMYLRNICKAANERFQRLSRQTMCLEMNDKNDFIIRDLLNDGQTRSVRTLSGGQIFQASLCLALALADNIRTTTEMSQNFFFLDEGFGTLDRDSLDVVFETLKALKKEHRIVGVISHVEDMQQEIGRYLKVSLDEVKGSVIEMV